MNILDKIASVKREEVKSRKITTPVTLLERSAFFKKQMISFHDALSKPFPSIIGEFKRRSPSRGDINPSADIRMVAFGYQEAGIAAMSVLTDTKFFGGKNSDLQDIAGIIDLPFLRKDFIVDEYQVVEAKAIGAAAILLIATILSKREVDTLAGLATNLGMDTLFEIHDLSDLDKMSPKIKIIGVNNRDLKTFEVSMDNSNELFQHLPQDCIKVAESGFQTHEDVGLLFKNGYDAFLIGERFMKTEDPGRSAAEFINNLRSQTR